MNNLNEDQLKEYLHKHLTIKLFTESHEVGETLAVGLYLDDNIIDYDYIYTGEVKDWYC